MNNCCDPNKSHQSDPTAPEFQKPYNFIPSCNACGQFAVWIDNPLPGTPPPSANILPKITISRNTR